MICTDSEVVEIALSNTSKSSYLFLSNLTTSQIVTNDLVRL